MDKRRLQRTLDELRESHEQLNELAAETEVLSRRLAAQRRTQWILLMLAVVMLVGTSAVVWWSLSKL